MPNRLKDETSPYLRQHADNPVDWYPWGEEAWEASARSGRPVLLSIGYAACHWCHVMAHESFEDPETAAQMNRDFVNIKVDREERPDLDLIYQTAHQILARRGGGLAPDRFSDLPEGSLCGRDLFSPDLPLWTSRLYGAPWAYPGLLRRAPGRARERWESPGGGYSGEPFA